MPNIIHLTHLNQSTMSKKSPMTPAAANRIKSAITKANGGITPKGSFASRAESAAVRNVMKGIVPIGGKRK